MRIEHLALYLDRFVAEEIRSVHGLGPFLIVVLLLQDRRSSQRTSGAGYITDLVHVSQRILRLAHVVDEVGSGFDILGIFRDYPSVEPYIRSLLRYDVIQHHTHLGCFLDRELCIAGPAQVHPCLAFGHFFFTEVHFPSADLFLCTKEHLFYCSYALRRDVMHQLIAGHFACCDLVFERIQNEYGIDIAERIFHQNTVLEFRIQHSTPRAQILAVNELRIVDKSGRTPHVTHGVVAYFHVSARSHLLELVRHVRRDIVEIPDAVCDQVFPDRLDQVFFQHPLDDILRRAEYIVVLVTHFDLGQRGLVDVEGLIHQLYFFAGLCVIPFLEILLDVLVNVVRPVEHFQLVCAVRTVAGTEDKGQSDKVQSTKN